MNQQLYTKIEEGSAVIVNGSNVIGLVTSVDPGRGLAWVKWPAGCGLSTCLASSHLHVICACDEVLQAIQVIAPAQQLSNPLERAFLQAAQPSASTQIVELDEAERVRPYYRPKANYR